MRVVFPSGSLYPALAHDSEHGPDWLERHKKVAANDSQFLLELSQEEFCAACHDGGCDRARFTRATI